MPNRSVAVTLTANISGFTAAMAQAAASAATAGKAIAKSVDGHSAQLDRIGNAAIGMGGLILAGVGLAVKTFADFDAEMSNVQAATHETDANMARLRDTAMQLGADTVFSAREAAQGMEELAKAGVSTNDIIGGGLKGSLDLAAAGGLSVAESAETAATALVQFGLSGQDVPHVADLLAAGAGKAQGSVHDLGMALKQGGLVASQYGASIEETTGTLAAFASAGLVGSDAGTSFKTMLMAMANPSKQAAELMDKLGISMYDSQGRFKGMAAIAGNLQTALSGMSEAERNAALATIFGSDAVRSANVLYTQGQAGIQGWIDKVNDQGYAAETASARLDNLRGDVEKLGGAVQTALISMGAGADGPLRDLVQSITGLVDAFNQLPAPIQQGTLLVAAVAGAGALAAGGLIKLVTTTGELITAWGSVGPMLAATDAKFVGVATGAGQAATAIRTLGAAAAAVGVALAALFVAGQVSNAIVGGEIPAVDEYAAALKNLATEAPGAGQALDAAFANSGLSSRWLTGLQTQVTDLGSALKAFREDSRDPWTNLSTGIAGVVGMDTQLSLLRENFQQMDKALAGMDSAKAGQSFKVIADEASRAGYSLSDTMGLFPDYEASLRKVAAQLGVTGLSQQDYYQWMQGNVPQAIAAATAATSQNAQALTEQASAADAARKSISDLANTMLAQSGSLIGLEAAFDAATKSIENNGKSHDLNTEKGRANQQALDGIASSALKYSEAAIAAGTSTDIVAGNMQRARDNFVSSAVAMGYSHDEAVRLADAYGLIPGSVQTNVSAPGAKQSAADVNAVTAAIRNLPPDQQRTIKTLADLYGYNTVRAALDSLHDRQVTITTRHVEQVIYQEYKVSGITSVGGLTRRGGGPIDGAAMARASWTPWHIGAPQFAGGGFTGAGPRRVDRIPAWLSANEFVQNDKAVDLYGLPFMHALNATQIPPEWIRAMGYAGGGSPSGGAAQSPVGLLTGRDIESAFRRALAAADVVVVRRSDFSLLGGGV